MTTSPSHLLPQLLLSVGCPWRTTSPLLALRRLCGPSPVPLVFQPSPESGDGLAVHEALALAAAHLIVIRSSPHGFLGHLEHLSLGLLDLILGLLGNLHPLPVTVVCTTHQTGGERSRIGQTGGERSRIGQMVGERPGALVTWEEKGQRIVHHK